ncbi:MAG: hypothetical protein R2932_24295 [Caldilineaceae bacterium]
MAFLVSQSHRTDPEYVGRGFLTGAQEFRTASPQHTYIFAPGGTDWFAERALKYVAKKIDEHNRGVGDSQKVYYHSEKPTVEGPMFVFEENEENLRNISAMFEYFQRTP